MKHSNITNPYDWEVPEIDLNMRHYAGHPSDIIKKIKSSIEDYLQNPNVPEKTRSIYSAIYHALNYYKNISYLPSPEYGTEQTFLSNVLATFNDDYKFLTDNFKNTNTLENDKPVISICGRIKSLHSFVGKVKEKVDEYVDENRDLQYFNESIRDLIGVRIIVDPPQKVQSHGLKAENDYLYDVYQQLMLRHGILSENSEELENGFKFIPVNSRYDKNKLQKIKERVEKEGFSSKLYDENGNLKIFIPSEPNAFMQLEKVSNVCKDYNIYPKYEGYQSLHTCVTPRYSKDVKPNIFPSYIIPSKSSDYSFEYQVRTAKQDRFAEFGLAAHQNYKEKGDYHRLLIPTYITNDNYLKYNHPEILNERIYEPSSASLLQRKESDDKMIHVRNYGESFSFYAGTPFRTYFNIPFREFRDDIISSERNDILSGKKEVYYDRSAEKYKTKQTGPKAVVLTENDILQLHSILQSEGVNLIQLLEQAGLGSLTDSILEILPENPSEEANILKPDYTNNDKIITLTHHPKKPSVYTIETSDDREHSQTSPKDKTVKFDSNKSSKSNNSSKESDSQKETTDAKSSEESEYPDLDD